ncbi:hypothetical protein JZ751_019082 [Albula glossodonta]|uniref:Selenocysteine lyase n=1 Tax=Albula glossodonta TaxID=121402 RepID=A0A8T2NMT9_9TELE|nr:hypothetical protein JZ751_019082 [Albula glossodonta]
MGEEVGFSCDGHHAFGGHSLWQYYELQEERIYMDYNATTPMEPEVIQAVTEALQEAWGNPSSNYLPGRKARSIINQSRESVARMVAGRAEDIIFTSGGTEGRGAAEMNGTEGSHHNGKPALPHIIISNVEHDSVRLTVENLSREGRADVTVVPVSKVTACVEVEDVMASIRPTTCLISVMLANNETGVLMPIRELCQRVRSANKQRPGPRILVHTDAAQAIGKVRVDVQDLGVDYLTIVGHKFYAPRIGALYVNGPGTTTPVFPMFFGGGQERNFRPGTENTPMIAGLGKAAELVSSNLPEYQTHLRETRLYLEQRLQVRFNSHFPGSDTLPNTCNVSILGPGLQGRKVLSNCKKLLASVGAACHSDRGDRPSRILLSSGVPAEVAANALRLSVGRGTTRGDVDQVVQDLKEAVQQLEGGS